MPTRLNPAREPRRGDRRIVTDRELGSKADTIIRDSRAARAENVRALWDNADEPRGVFAQKYRLAPNNSNSVVPYTTAVTVTGHTREGDALVATYMASASAFIAQQQETLRFAANGLHLGCGDATDIFAIVGPWHLPELQSLVWAKFENVTNNRIPSSALKSVCDWTRGRELIWFTLPSLAAARAAAELCANVKALNDLQGQIVSAESRGDDPDPRVVRRYDALKLGLDAYWFFVGYQRATEVEREPSLKAIEAAAQNATIVIDHSG